MLCPAAHAGMCFLFGGIKHKQQTFNALANKVSAQRCVPACWATQRDTLLVSPAHEMKGPGLACCGRSRTSHRASNPGSGTLQVSSSLLFLACIAIIIPSTAKASSKWHAATGGGGVCARAFVLLGGVGDMCKAQRSPWRGTFGLCLGDASLPQPSAPGPVPNTMRYTPQMFYGEEVISKGTLWNLSHAIALLLIGM